MDRNEFLRPLAELADQGQWDDAYIWFREHQEQFSRREQRLVREALALWSVFSLVPYAQDLPLVLEGKWHTGIVTLEMEEDTAWNNAMAQLGRETREGYDPIPWYSNPRWSKLLMPIMPDIYNRWMLNIHVDGVDCRMGQLQFDLTDYEMNTYPVRIDYLPHSRLVLWISCGEES